jgi:gamma-glutamyltranspeptidase/glutathione hydrolase
VKARGVIAAGHPLTAEAGARVLHDGGNAVDAALAAMLTAFVAEPLLTGLGAGGYMLVAGPQQAPVVLDFFVDAPGREGGPRPAKPLVPVEVDFGDAVQVFHVGAASCGVYGTPAGVCEAARLWGSRPLEELVAPAAALARGGVVLNHEQAYVAHILGDLLRSSPECEALWSGEDGVMLREGDVQRNPDLADALERLGAEGAQPFYEGEIAQRVAAWIAERGGALSGADLGAYEATLREPVHVRYRGRDVFTNPPPSAGGTLLAYTLALLEREKGTAPGPAQLVAVMEAAQRERTPEFLAGLADEGFVDQFLASRLGSTTHVSVLDASGLACSVTVTNGEGSAMVVPATGIHVNNIMGEADLSPLGFHMHEPGKRMPSMMAPTAVLRDGEAELVLGSAGSNRIRSALLQTIVGVVDHGLDVVSAVSAPRLHFEDGTVYAEPGIEGIDDTGHAVARFRAPNLFFGGVQAVRQDGPRMSGAGDPRRGGVAVAV